MQTPESVKLDILSDLIDLSNSTRCASADSLSPYSSKPFGERKSREMILK